MNTVIALRNTETKKLNKKSYPTIYMEKSQKEKTKYQLFVESWIISNSISFIVSRAAKRLKEKFQKI